MTEWLLKRFQDMKSRCYCASSTSFPYYGGSGVLICDQWLDDPETFVAWSLAVGATPDLEIDRIDRNGPYSVENCRWVSKAENLRNRPSKSLWNWTKDSSANRLRIIEDDALDMDRLMLEWADAFLNKRSLSP